MIAIASKTEACEEYEGKPTYSTHLFSFPAHCLNALAQSGKETMTKRDMPTPDSEKEHHD